MAPPAAAPRAPARTPAGGDPVSGRDARGGKPNNEPVSRILVAAVLAFVGIASGVLLWEGLAVGATHGPAVAGRERWRARARIAVGVTGLAIVLWIAFGLLTRAW
jgi:hypothetical protein